MGYYRFLLSVLVALSHSGIYYWGVNQGVVAVIAFLLLSGYTTDIVLTRMHVANFKEMLKSYYLGRFIRIFPLYWFYVLLTVLIVWGGIQHETIHEITLETIANNLLLFPLDYSCIIPYFAAIMERCDVIPAAWTLGLQVTFYLIAPFLFMMQNNKKLFCLYYVVFGGSFLLFILAVMGKIPGYYCYSFLPGMLWIFILGTFLNRETMQDFLYFFYFGIVILFLYMGSTGKYLGVWNKEIVLGLVLAIPVINFFKTFPRGKLENFLGNISYGIYLNHFTVKTVILNLIGHEPHSFPEWFIFISVSVIIAIIGHYMIEIPLKKRWIQTRQRER